MCVKESAVDHVNKYINIQSGWNHIEQKQKITRFGENKREVSLNVKSYESYSTYWTLKSNVRDFEWGYSNNRSSLRLWEKEEK